MSYNKIPDFIQTFTGKHIRPLNLDPADICIEDIAHHLANQCRFSGAVRIFYSVAEHSVRVAALVPPEDKLDALLHDGSEYALIDFPRPLKHDPVFGQRYRGAEARAQAAVNSVFGTDHTKPSVKAADQTLLVTEARDLMHGTESWGHYTEDVPLPQVIVPWSPRKAERKFLALYTALTKES